jgi:outer membrane lipoprotein SlyB
MILLPVFLAGGLGACANNGVQPGYVNTSYGGTTATAQTYGNPVPGGTGRVVSINDVSLRGGGGGGSGNGSMIGGLLGGLGGVAIGASGGRGIGGGLIGGVLGAVGGAIAGTIIDRQSGGGRGIEVTVQRDDGQQVTVAQRDDGDVQLGDRVQIVQDRSGTAKVVRDNGRQPDYGQPPQTYQPAPQAGNYPPPQDYRQPPPQDYRAGGYAGAGGYGPPPQDYRTSGGGYGGSQGGGYSGSGGYGPPPQDYRQAGYSRPQSTTYTPIGGGQYQQHGTGNPQPGDDPRYGTIQ